MATSHATDPETEYNPVCVFGSYTVSVIADSVRQEALAYSERFLKKPLSFQHPSQPDPIWIAIIDAKLRNRIPNLGYKN